MVVLKRKGHITVLIPTGNVPHHFDIFGAPSGVSFLICTIIAKIRLTRKENFSFLNICPKSSCVLELLFFAKTNTILTIKASVKTRASQDASIPPDRRRITSIIRP